MNQLGLGSCQANLKVVTVFANDLVGRLCFLEVSDTELDVGGQLCDLGLEDLDLVGEGSAGLRKALVAWIWVLLFGVH